MDDDEDVFSEQLIEANLEHNLRALERRFFKNIKPLKAIELVRNAAFPARFLPIQDVIQIDESVARFPKLSQLLIVHELIHRKLTLHDPAYTQNPYGAPFRAEVRELCKNDAYVDLL